MVPMVPTITCHCKNLITTIYTYVCNDNMKVDYLFPFPFFFRFFSHPMFLFILFTTFFVLTLFSFPSLPSPLFPPSIIVVLFFLGCHIVFDCVLQVCCTLFSCFYLCFARGTTFSIVMQAKV